jgi:hypothetical protein
MKAPKNRGTALIGGLIEGKSTFGVPVSGKLC